MENSAKERAEWIEGVTRYFPVTTVRGEKVPAGVSLFSGTDPLTSEEARTIAAGLIKMADKVDALNVAAGFTKN